MGAKHSCLIKRREHTTGRKDRPSAGIRNATEREIATSCVPQREDPCFHQVPKPRTAPQKHEVTMETMDFPLRSHLPPFHFSIRLG